MAYYVDRVVICDAFAEPTNYYRLLLDGTSKLTDGRRPSMTLKAQATDLRGGVAGARSKAQPTLIEESLFDEQANAFVNDLRGQLTQWRDAGYPGTARVTRRLLEWWFERPEERHAEQQRLFFCQQEAIEAVIYLYEVKGRFKMPETADLLRYALKLATGTGKTIVMALLITWSTLHKTKVSRSTLSTNFLVLVPNLTVRDRVSGDTRGDGLVPNGTNDLYRQMDVVPPEYLEAFRPRVVVRNWHAIPLVTSREDWIPDKGLADQRFVPYSVARALERRQRRDPCAGIRKMLKGWRDAVIINDEAHHAYGETAPRGGGDPGEVVWNKVINAVRDVSQVSLVVDLSATPWYGSGSAKPDGTLFEWLVSDFSVYDAFESGLVKVVRMPEADTSGRIYIDLWDFVKDAKTKTEFLAGGRDAIARIYSSWKDDYLDWEAKFAEFRDLQPVLLVVAANAKHAGWLFEHLTEDYDLLRNDDPDVVTSFVTIEVNTSVFNADKGREATLREMVNTVGRPGALGARVRCIVSVNMLSEGWDVKSISHIIGFRAFGSPLLTEQVVGRGLRRTDYSVLYEPLEDRGDGSDETVDAFGIPFVGFPVQKTRKRPRTGKPGETPVPIEPEHKKRRFRMTVPNVRSWAVGVSKPLSEVVDIAQLRQLTINPSPDVAVSPIVGEGKGRELSLSAFRAETPIPMVAMRIAAELLRRTSPQDSDAVVPGIGPTFEELLDVVQAYLNSDRVHVADGGDPRDVWIPMYRDQVLDTLETALQDTSAGLNPVPMLGDPPHLDTDTVKFRWIGPRASGKKCHLGKIACDSDLEVAFADFLDSADDVLRYVKNERFGFSVTYFEGGRPRQYYPDFVVHYDIGDGERYMVIETKGEVWPNTDLKRQAAEKWCALMTDAGQGDWHYLFVHQPRFERVRKQDVRTLQALRDELEGAPDGPQVELLVVDADAPKAERFKSLLPLYTLEAAAGYFGEGHSVDLDGWVRVDGKIDDQMFVSRVVGRSMEPRIADGSLCVFRANPGGSRQGKIVLVQYRGPADPETGGAYTVKRYTSQKKIDEATGDLLNVAVTLYPDNAEYEPILLTPEFESDVAVIAELLSVLGEG